MCATAAVCPSGLSCVPCVRLPGEHRFAPLSGQQLSSRPISGQRSCFAVPRHGCVPRRLRRHCVSAHRRRHLRTVRSHAEHHVADYPEHLHAVHRCAVRRSVRLSAARCVVHRYADPTDGLHRPAVFRSAFRSVLTSCPFGARYCRGMCRGFGFCCYYPFRSPVSQSRTGDVFAFLPENAPTSHPSDMSTFSSLSLSVIFEFINLSEPSKQHADAPSHNARYHASPRMRRSTELRATAVIGKSSSPSSSRPRTVISNDISSVRSRCI